MSKSRSQRGYSLIEIVVVMAIIGVVVALGADFVSNSIRARRVANTTDKIFQVRNKIVEFLRNDWGWAQMAQANIACLGAGDCMADFTASNTFQITPLDANGNRLTDGGGTNYDPVANASHGFTNDAGICTGFSATTHNFRCPFRIEVEAAPICVSAGIEPVCPAPLWQVNVNLVMAADAPDHIISRFPSLFAFAVLRKGHSMVVNPGNCPARQSVINIDHRTGVFSCAPVP